MKIISDKPLTKTSALHLLHRAGQCADELFSSNVGENNLTPRQFEILKSVSENNNPSQTALVGLTGIDRSTLADIVRRLVERGHLHRERTANDARRYAVKLTKLGRQTLEQTTPAVSSTNESLLSSLPKEHHECFLVSLEKIIDSITTSEPEPGRKKAA